ncbi:membrane protein [Nonlabens ulvanivorans]|uniref:Membrane protein n=2 Tax=Nonlabens TaxID=363408 RepID=A0A081DCN6_NONUL|nr:tetratricopeptide repeat protein [Nonlabens ulvanivorans]GAK76682.1 membrane protein [Nonlabens ulvanivorans]
MTDPSRATNYIDFMGGLNYYVKPEYASSMELQTVLADYKRNYENGRISAQEYVDFLVELREAVVIEKPDGLDNASYFLNYQVQYMYMRYFMWNFTGRQNDIQGEGDPFNGNWISGIPFIDEWHLGTQDNLSEDMLNNKGRNTYFFLPLILGLIGMIFHAKKDLKSFYVTLVLFLFTGLAIIVYLNQSMYQVRERDYAYVGSFLVFAMWIGMGVYAIYEGIKDSISVKTARILSLTVCFAAVPLLMAFQNWDDHDRSGKYSALTSAKKYLDSCLPDALIFTIGDNDTFPLWYLQEVEGYRTDVRVVCTSLLATDWYMDDMKKKAWDSDPVPSTLTHDKYTYGTRDALWFADKERVLQRTGGKSSLPDTLDLKDWMEWVASDKKITQEQMRNDHWEHTFPTKFIRIPVNKEAVLKNGVVPQRDADKIVDEIVIEINSSLVYKNRMFMLDIINANNWERPIYFSGGAFGDDDYIWMKDYLQLDGCAFRLLPIKTEPENRRDPFDMGRVDPDRGYEILKKWDWRNSGNPDMYYDVETRRNSVGYRSNVTRVAEALTKAGDYKRAEEILDLGMEKMPLDLYGHYSMIEPFVNGYYEVGQVDKAQNLLDRVILKYQDEIDFYKALNIDERRASYSDIIAAVERYRSLVESAIFYEDDKMVQKHKDVFNQYVLEFTQFYSPEETIGGSSREEIPTSELDNIFQEATDNTVTEDIIETNPQDTP